MNTEELTYLSREQKTIAEMIGNRVRDFPELRNLIIDVYQSRDSALIAEKKDLIRNGIVGYFEALARLTAGEMNSAKHLGLPLAEYRALPQPPVGEKLPEQEPEVPEQTPVEPVSAPVEPVEPVEPIHSLPEQDPTFPL